MVALASPWRTLDAERRFFLGVASILTLVVVIGFGPTWYWAPLVGGRPLPWSVHLHGIFATAWLLLFATQVGLVAGNRRDLHRQLGRSGALVAALAIGTALLVAIEALRTERTVPSPLPPATLFFVQLVTVVTFVGFVAVALKQRAVAASHKRWMLLASLTIAIPAFARLARQIDTPPLPANAFGGMLLANIVLAALALFDMRTRGRLHPVTLWGGAIFLLAQPLRFAVGTSGWWVTFCEQFR
jgi:hypothetical protein